MSKRIFIIIFSVAALSFIVGGCVWNPSDGSFPHTRTPSVNGWAYVASTTVTFYGYNWTTEDWDVVGSTTSASTSSTYKACTGYAYSGTADLDDGDYWDAGEEAIIKVKQGSLYLYSFTAAGKTCMQEKLDDDWGCYEAGEECMSANSPEIHLYDVMK